MVGSKRGGDPPPFVCEIFQKKWVDWESNPGPLRAKPLQYQLSHRGIVIELKHGPTHILLARFLVGPKLCFGPTLHVKMCVCLLVFCGRHLLLKRKFQKNHGELNLRCLHELPIHYQVSYPGLSI